MALLAARLTKSFAILRRSGHAETPLLTAELLAEFGMDPKHLSFWEMEGWPASSQRFAPQDVGVCWSAWTYCMVSSHGTEIYDGLRKFQNFIILIIVLDLSFTYLHLVHWHWLFNDDFISIDLWPRLPVEDFCHTCKNRLVADLICDLDEVFGWLVWQRWWYFIGTQQHRLGKLSHGIVMVSVLLPLQHCVPWMLRSVSHILHDR